MSTEPFWPNNIHPDNTAPTTMMANPMMSDANMTDPIVSTTRSRRVWPWVAAVLLVVAVVVAFVVPVPYYLEGPGSTRATQQFITISGHESFESEGQVRLVTVSQRHATLAALALGWLRPNIDIVSERDVIGTVDRKTERLINQAQMDRSKLVALVAAFDVLGLPITITGHGALVQGFTEDEVPARSVLQVGDVITAVGERSIATTTELRSALDGAAPGDVVTVTVSRLESQDPLQALIPSAQRHELAVEVELARNPEEDRAMLGVTVQTFNETVDTGFSVEFDSGGVLGPSAGLAWTLGLIDRLTPGDLTGGRVVGVTGEIDAAGNVGAIGGVDKKVVGAIRDGATVFLYPSETSEADLKRLEKAAGGRIELHAVSTLREALALLDPAEYSDAAEN